MKYVKSRKDFLGEALSLSTAKKYRKGWDENQWKSLFQEWTDDPRAYRIYLPFVAPKVDAGAPPQIDNFLDSIGWNVDDYRLGLAKEKSTGRAMKIGKLINKYGDRETLKIFTEDPGRLKPREWEIVISRHPYDLAGMSTDRGWTSCMQLDVANKGEVFIPRDIKAGTIIAYLIRKGDRNINNPSARVLIKPYQSIEDPSETVLVADRTIYGQFIPGFLDAVQDWLDEVNRGKSGVYRIDPKLYPENAEYDATIVAQGILDSNLMSSKSIYYYSLIPDADAEVLGQMASSPNADTKALVSIAMHDNTPTSTLERLAATANPSIKRAVATNPATPMELRFALIDSLNLKQIFQMFTQKRVHFDMPPDIIRKLWNRTSPGKDDYSTDGQIRLQLSVQKNVPLDILKEMSEDSYNNVRLNSIRNREIALLLASDPDDLVRWRAEKYLAAQA
jgi:hypothetical protein